MLLLIENPLNASPYTFPILECIHIVGFAFSVGTIGIVDLRMLGVGVRNHTAEELAASMAPWTLFGLGIMLTSGPLLFSSDPDAYYLNWAFQLKMALLLLAIIIHYTLRRRVVASGSEGAQKFVASVSLLLWVSIIFAGIFYAFT